MNQRIKSRKSLIAFLVLTMIAMYGFVPLAEAASLTSASNRLSDSHISKANVTHTITFTTNVALTQTYYMQATFPAGFTNVLVGGVTCPSNSTASVNSQNVICTVNSGQTLTPGVYTITVTGVTNPGSEGSQLFLLRTYSNTAVEQERADVRVAIISNVSVSATVSATLAFTIEGLATSTTVNGETTTGSSTATALAFGVLPTGGTASSSLGQQLRVTTNADYGYQVTVHQNDELTSNAGSNINSFDNSPDNTGSTTPHAWNAPAGILDSQHTYGHMGVITDDATLNGIDFTGNKYAGLNASDTMQLMYHDGPSDGATQNKGAVKVAYKIQISVLQEAGDYYNTLTYVCTPTY